MKSQPRLLPRRVRRTGAPGQISYADDDFSIAPLRRPDIAANNGFTALEKASENARQTPFSKCEVRWHAPIQSGDFITSFGHILNKEERRGNKFVTFRVEATNQNDEKVAEYDYTCFFEYAKGQNTRKS